MKTLFLMLAIICFATSCRNKEYKIMYQGNDLSDKIQIKRDKQTKAAYLIVDKNEKWKLYGGTTVENINLSEPVAIGEGSGTFPIDVDSSVRWYFYIVSGKDKAILAERHLPMSGGYNFRDLGGIPTKDGRHVKWGKILRSDDLHNLTDADLDYLSSVPLVSVVDFRSEGEIRTNPDKLPVSVKNAYPLSISPGNITSVESIEGSPLSRMDTIMMEINKMLVSDPVCTEQYKTYFKLLQDSNNIPLMFHCSAGKDRTGMAAALTLAALGVDEKTILNDYLSSNNYLSGKYTKYIEEKPNLKPLFEVKPEFIKAGLDFIENEHGSLENYLEKVLEVDIQKMRGMYLD
ncbi:tyrosine-protein phosphatase [Dysgonomonas sp. 216]|uniref:tyrosine-protein phosphatase n=1 Tax=Dysgonomonas sp. 216 TaxID=2302934 RepID=UPI0013D02347|nr:tyrosine-protein phosphatase [Dysgonomonas sp. 216]NDW17658.1 tyrosine-protein phosphatase [Dysgonomonas sp. 216]